MHAWLSIMVLCVGALLLGIWHGEDLSDPFVQLYDVAGGAIWLMVWLLVAWRRRGVRAKSVTAAIFVPALLVAGLYVGNQVSTRAYNECVRKGELVRVALEEFYLENARYPERLDSLQMVKMPGARLLRDNVLQYRTNGEGYELFFGDWLMSHTATESSPFKAYK